MCTDCRFCAQIAGSVLCTVINSGKNNCIFFNLKVLDDEAEVFMIKLWRLIIYEAEAKRLGLNPTKAVNGAKI